MSQHEEISEESISTEVTRSVVAAGCFAAIISAVVTGVLLFVNGSLVLAAWLSFRPVGDEWYSKREFGQFLIYSVPLGLVVIQWMMIDYVRMRLRFKSSQ
ncbi:MAG: hypothetical protein AAF664_15640 [Planctomycetota bacterium]